MTQTYQSIELMKPQLNCEAGVEGVLHLRHDEKLEAYSTSIIEKLFYWASTKPEQVCFAEKNAAGQWDKLSYKEAARSVKSLAQALLDIGLGSERPLAVLSGNSVAHAQLVLACQYVGIPICPVSPAYSLISKDFGKLRHVVELLNPGAFYVEELAPFVPALKVVGASNLPVICKVGGSGDISATEFSTLLSVVPGAGVEKAAQAVTQDTVAKILFTSGSTGMPKGVINTNRMIVSNQQMLQQALPFLVEQPPILLDWLPWNHTFGGNHNFGLVIYNGGSLYIDNGKPTPKGITQTLENLREVSPTLYFNVPKGYEILLQYLESDEDLARRFFANLNMLFYAGAGLSQGLADRLQNLSIKLKQQKIFFTTSLGSTETAPAAVFNTQINCKPGEVGLPLPGVQLKLIPNGGKMEARVKGPNVTPGYWKQDDLTEKAFDEDGYYKLGDALKFADDSDHSKGLLFDGRISEDFKLDTGTWVCVSSIRNSVIHHFSPLFSDVVITGHNRGDVGILAVANEVKCLELLGLGEDAMPLAQVLDEPEFRQHILKALKSLAKQSTGSSNRVQRLSVLERAPSLDAHEITDKGSLNQRAIIENRTVEVEALYTGDAKQKVFHLSHNE